MKGIWTICRRDLKSYFTSPIGYMFMIVFVLISVGLYTTSFFTFPEANMRMFFANIPVLLCVFIPAVTMRVWAEERKENTWEMLLTFPLKAYQLVLGKFFACLIFYALTLLATVTVPVMLAVLGDPDNGAIVGGYLGAFLLGAFFLAVGIFFSGFNKDQIVAFVVSLLACFALFLIGTTFIAGYIDNVWNGLGKLLSDVAGITDHYNAFTRGVVELGDVIFFLVWTVVFLALNILYIDGRNRPGARTSFAVAVVLCVGIGLTLNSLVLNRSLARLDLTENKVYTVSQASTRILSGLESPVTVNVYITPEDRMPTAMKDLQRDVTDKLEELQVASGNKLRYNVMHLDASALLASQQDLFAQPDDEEEELDEEKTVEQRMLDKGVQPFSVQAFGDDGMTTKAVYSSIGIAYQDQPEEIIQQVMPQTLHELEYRLVSTVYKLALEDKPVVALVAPQSPINPQMRRMMEQMGRDLPPMDDPYEFLPRYLHAEKYDVRRVELTKDSPLPEEYDTLVVVDPAGLDERQRWEINRALHSGKSVIMAVQQYEWSYENTQRGYSVSKRPRDPQVNDLLDYYGLGVSEDILMDANHVALTIQDQSNPLASLLGLGQPLDLPTHIVLGNAGMNQDNAVTNRLNEVFYLWGTALELDDDKLAEQGLDAQILMTTSNNAWTLSADETPDATYFDPPPERERKQYATGVMVVGQFPDAFGDVERPGWPKEQPRPGQPPMPDMDEEEPPSAPVEPAPGKLILLGAAKMFNRDFIRSGGNADLFLNSIDALSLGDDLVNVRGAKPIDRIIEKPDASTRRFWKMINYGLAVVIIAAVGIITTVVRRRSRNAYTMAYVKAGE